MTSDNLNSPGWDQLFWAFQEENNQEKLKSIPKTNLKYLLDDDNLEMIVDSALKALQKAKGSDVTVKSAEELVEQMRTVARKIMNGQI